MPALIDHARETRNRISEPHKRKQEIKDQVKQERGKRPFGAKTGKVEGGYDEGDYCLYID